MDLPQCLIIRIDMLFHPCALSTFRFFIFNFISSSVKVIFSILLLVLNFKVGSWLLLITGVHWEAKYELKSSSFSAKFETNLSSARIGGIMGIFLLPKNQSDRIFIFVCYNKSGTVVCRINHHIFFIICWGHCSISWYVSIFSSRVMQSPFLSLPGFYNPI